MEWIDDLVLFPLLTRLWVWQRLLALHHAPPLLASTPGSVWRLSWWRRSCLLVLVVVGARVGRILMFLSALLSRRSVLHRLVMRRNLTEPTAEWRMHLLLHAKQPTPPSSLDLPSLTQVLSQVPNTGVPRLVDLYDACKAFVDFKQTVRADTKTQENAEPMLRQLWRLTFPHLAAPLNHTINSVIDLDSDNDDEKSDERICAAKPTNILNLEDSDEDERIVDKPSSSWEMLGFQGEDPRTDLRGMGIRSVKTMLYIGERYGDFVHRVLNDGEDRNNGSSSSWGQQYAIIVIACVDFCTRHLLLTGLLDHYILTYRPEDKKTAGTSEIAFNECVMHLLQAIDHTWQRQRPRDIMAFPQVFAEAQRRMLRQVLPFSP